MQGKFLNIIEEFVYWVEKQSALEVKEININLNEAFKHKLLKEIAEESMYFSSYNAPQMEEIITIRMRGVEIRINDSLNKNVYYTNKFHEFLYDRLNG